MKDKNNAAVYYSINMLRQLLDMKLITEEEYYDIIRIVSAYYEVELYCV